MSKKILLVEDEALIAMAEAHMLKNHGYEVVTAYNGEKAIETADSDPDISLILMDIDLGKGMMDGTEAAEIILKGKDIPVVFLSSHTEPEVVEKTEGITSYGYVVKNSGTTVLDASIKMAFKLFEAKNEAKKHEEALRESESNIRKRLKAITEPEGDIDTLELADIIDVEELQLLMEDTFKVTKVGGAILDVSGKILVCTTMEDICREFHRVHPDTAKNCLESDLALAGGVPAGTFKAYRCKNNMWDMVTPLEIGGKHLGNIYIGQFFFAEEDVDYEVFRKQARQHGFDETAYIAALDRVPRLKREDVDRAMAFYSRLAGMISSLSYTTIKLSRNMVQHKQVKERLKENEEKFRTFVENANDIIYQLTPEGVFTYVSPNWTEILGYRQEEVIGEKVEKFVHPDDLHRCIDFLNNVLATGEKQSGVEYRVKHKNGTWRWHNSNGAPIKDKNGKIISYVGIAREITEHKHAEKLLKERNATLHEINQYSIELSFLQYDELYPYIIKKLKNIFKTSTAWITEYDENTAQMVVKATSLSDEDNSWVMKKLGKMVIGHRTPVNEEQREMMKNVQVGTPQTLHEVSFGAIPENSAKLIQKKLNIDWFMPVAFINKGKITGASVIAVKAGEEAPERELLLVFAGITGEVMRRKRAEGKLDEEKNLLQNITANMFDLVALTDRNGTYNFVSKSHSVLGYDPGHLLGKNAFDFVHPEDFARIEAYFKEIIHSNKTEGKEEFRYRCADDSYIWVETVGKKLLGENGEIKELIFSSRDITERKNSEYKLWEALKEKDFLMKEINHRVKNSLLMVSSLINLKDSETEADLSDIKHQIGAISLIHERLYQTENVIEIGCREYFAGLLNSIFSSFSIFQVRVETNIDEIYIPTKSAMSLGLIINEIATNAIKYGFTDTEEAVFSVRMKDDREKNLYELTLSNTGNPFPEDIDIKNTNTLGLRLITALVVQIDGTLELQKEPHPVFTIRFPKEQNIQ